MSNSCITAVKLTILFARCTRQDISIGYNLTNKRSPGVELSALAVNAQGGVNCRGVDTGKGCLHGGGNRGDLL